MATRDPLGVLHAQRLHEPRNGLSANSEVFDREWAHFLEARTQLLNEVQARLGLMDAAKQQPGVTPQAAGTAANSVVDQQVQAGTFQTELPSDWDGLVGAARSYGVQNPEKLPVDVLRGIVKDNRLRRASGEGPQSGFVQDLVGAIGVGSMEGVVNILDGVPFLGDALRKRGVTSAANQWLAELGEYYRGDMQGEDVDGLANLADLFSGNEVAGWKVGKGLASLGLYIGGGAMVYRGAAGLLGVSNLAAPTVAAMGRTSVIGRLALAGLATEAVMEGGRDIPLEDKLLFMALGTFGAAAHGIGGLAPTLALGGGIGAGAGYAVGGDAESAIKGGIAGASLFAAAPKLFGRLRRSFPTSGADVMPNDGPRLLGAGPDVPGSGGGRRTPGPNDPPIVDAEWWPVEEPTAVARRPDPTRWDGAPLEGTLEPPTGLAPGPRALPPAPMDAEWQAAAQQRMLPGQPALGPGTGVGFQMGPRGMGGPAGPAGFLPATGTPDVQGMADLPMLDTSAPRGPRQYSVVNLDDFANAEDALDVAMIPGSMPPARQLMMPSAEGELVEHNLRMFSRPVSDFLDETSYRMEYRAEVPGQDPVAIELSYRSQDKELVFESVVNARTGNFDDRVSLGAGGTGNGVVRRYARSIVEDLRLFGFEPDIISGYRITGATAGKPESIRAFPVSLLYGQRPSQAVRDAIAMAKTNIIMESDELARMATQPTFDDYDVAVASVSSNPAGISIVRNIGDQARTIRQLVQNQLEGGIGPQDWRLVNNPDGTTDLLVRGERGISNRAIAQYESYGMFEGQLAQTASGTEVVIVSPGEYDGITMVRSALGGPPIPIRTSELLPSNGSYLAPTEDAPALYQAFRAYAEETFGREATKAGLVQRDWLSAEMSSQLPRLMDDFFESIALESPITQATLRNYFDMMRVEDFHAIADPADLALEAGFMQEASDAVALAHLEGRQLPVLDAAAETKGFVPESTPGGGVILHDAQTGMFYSLSSEKAAEEFLKNFQRTPLDYTPISDVPVELLQPIPGGVHEGVTSEFIQPMQAQLEDLERGLVELENMMEVVPPAAGGGGTQPPPPPDIPGGPGDFFAEDPLRLPRPQRQSLGQQMEALRRGTPDERMRFAELQDRVQGKWLELYPMRNWTLSVSTAFEEAGIMDRTHQIYNRIVTGVTKAHNEGIPFYQEISRIVNELPRKWVRDGTLLNVLEAEAQDADKMMRDLKMNPAQRQAVADIRSFFDTVFGEAGLDSARYLFNYMPLVRSRMRAGQRFPYGDIHNLPKEIQFFAEYARGGNLDMRQTDVGVLMTHWVRAWQFKKHVGEAFEEMSATWQVHTPDHSKTVPLEPAKIIKDWLEVVRFGRNMQSEMLVQGVGQILRKFGVPLTDSEVVGMYNVAFANAYRGMLGLRPDVWFRDSIQPLLTGARIGFEHVAPVYKDFFKSPTKRAEMWERGLRHGWVEKGMVQLADAGTFTTPMPEWAPGTLDPKLLARREMFARWGDKIHDAMPKWMRGGIQGTWLDPLYVYTKEGEFNRLVSGEMGWRKAESALQKFRAGQIDEAALMHESGANAWRLPTQTEFKRLVDAWDDEAAQALLANEAANMQFRYGTREASPMIQRAGIKGRIGMMFGTFTTQYAANVAEIAAKDIPMRNRVGFAVRRNAVNAAIVGASAASGWNFMKWLWPASLTFAGGPGMGALVTAFNTYQGMVNDLTGQYVSNEQRAAANDFVRTSPAGMVPDAVAGMAGTFFPYAGGVKTLHSYGQAFGGAGDPAMDALRFTLTGERPQHVWRQAAADQFQRWTDEVVRTQDSIYKANPPKPGGGAF